VLSIFLLAAPVLSLPEIEGLLVESMAEEFFLYEADDENITPEHPRQMRERRRIRSMDNR